MTVRRSAPDRPNAHLQGIHWVEVNYAHVEDGVDRIGAVDRFFDTDGWGESEVIAAIQAKHPGRSVTSVYLTFAHTPARDGYKPTA